MKSNRVRKEMKALDEAAKKLEHVHFSKKLTLNVGGHIFSTSLETLTKDPGSILHAMFSERFDTKPSEDGSYFIDRDGTHFRYILNYLRTGELIVPEDEIVRRELLAEAEFYQVKGIVTELTARPFRIDSAAIGPSAQRQTLLNWLKDKRPLTTGFPVLLYRASRDGWTGANFHSRCDNKGPTVIVVSGYYQNLGNRLNIDHDIIFGGYTEEQWGGGVSAGVTFKKQDTFVFYFEKRLGQEQHQGGSQNFSRGTPLEHAVCRDEPVFRDGSNSVDFNAPNGSDNCSAGLGGFGQNRYEGFGRYMTQDQYSLPNYQMGGMYGNQRHILREMEVFGFEK